jgi:hypothetical protein
MYTLAMGMVPYYQTRQARQDIGLEGPDLAGQRRREILSSARDISVDSIQQFDMIQFHVASQSRPGAYYAINLRQEICDCPDFPRARFCKHIAAIYVHFPHLSPDKVVCNAYPQASQMQEPPLYRPGRAENSQNFQSLSQEVTALFGQVDRSMPSPAVMEAALTLKYLLSSEIAGTGAFPDKEEIPPNQKSWPETAERMGVKRAPKRKRLPEERRQTERCIGPTKGKRQRRLNDDDAYAGGERSGKRAKPDATSAAANARARAAAALPPSVA